MVTEPLDNVIETEEGALREGLAWKSLHRTRSKQGRCRGTWGSHESRTRSLPESSGRIPANAVKADVRFMTFQIEDNGTCVVLKILGFVIDLL